MQSLLKMYCIRRQWKQQWWGPSLALDFPHRAQHVHSETLLQQEPKYSSREDAYGYFSSTPCSK